MKQLKLLFISSLLLTMLISCNKNDKEEEFIDDESYDCTFVQNDDDMDGLIDDSERMIMNQCMENSLLSKSEIESNLIGEWELIGHGEGWIPRISQPCAYIIITEDELTFEFTSTYTDTITTHQWEVEELNWDGGQYFSLKVLPEDFNGLFINQFCENYMYGDNTIADGNMHLYAKVK